MKKGYILLKACSFFVVVPLLPSSFLASLNESRVSRHFWVFLHNNRPSSQQHNNTSTYCTSMVPSRVVPYHTTIPYHTSTLQLIICPNNNVCCCSYCYYSTTAISLNTHQPTQKGYQSQQKQLHEVRQRSRTIGKE
jgi:hypothetical protein